MKPEQFIREQGLNKARDVVAACPEYYHYYHIVEGVYYTCPKASRVAVKDLKHLVQSLELVKKLGGLQGAKAYVPDGYKSDLLKQAIRDHESIYGGSENA